jgi:phosphoribosylformylglycinamidine cyclo-ligase
MPGFYSDGEYDIAGFIVGIVERAKVIDGRSIVPGDVLIGLPSAGLHTNGYSLARHVMFETSDWTADTFVTELDTTVGEALLAPHRSYLSVVRPLLEHQDVRGLVHVTGGGVTENLPRILPDGCAAEVDLGAWVVPPLFRLLQQRGGIANAEMFRAFNMGIGMIVACAAIDVERVLDRLSRAGEPNAVRIGCVVPGDRMVQYRHSP